jgi:AcrR family transcriptional regulator
MGSIFNDLVSVPEPNQARSREALDRFLAAGEALLAENHYEEAGIADIAKKAESSVGTFYRLLTDKETLSLLLLQRFFTQIETLAEETMDPEQWRGQNITDIADAFVKVFVDAYHGHAGTLRALILRASKDSDFRNQVHNLNTLISSRLSKLLKQRREEISHPKPEQAIKSVTHMVLGILNQHTITGSLGGLSQRALVEELKRVFLTYLGVSN